MKDSEALVSGSRVFDEHRKGFGVKAHAGVLHFGRHEQHAADPLSGAQALADLDLQAAHHPGDRCSDLGTLEIEQGRVKPGPGRLNRWIGVHAGAAHQGIVGRELPLRNPAG